MILKRRQSYVVTLAVAVVYIAAAPFLFGFISELQLLGADAARLWSNISYVLACFALALAAALVLIRFLGADAWNAAMFVGLLSLLVFLLTQLIPAGVHLSTSLQIRAWVLNLVRASAVPLIVAFMTSSKTIEPTR